MTMRRVPDIFSLDLADPWERVLRWMAEAGGADFLVLGDRWLDLPRFYVFPRPLFLAGLEEMGPPRRARHVGEALPGLRAFKPAPTVAEAAEPAWSPEYLRGPWPGAFLPVAVRGEQPVALWVPEGREAGALWMPDRDEPPVRGPYLGPDPRIGELFQIFEASRSPSFGLPRRRSGSTRESEPAPRSAPSSRSPQEAYSVPSETVPRVERGPGRRTTRDRTPAAVPARAGAEPPPATTVFPTVSLSDPHPVAKAAVRIEVGLSEEEPEDVAGVVDLGDADRERVFVLQAHLLFAGQSLWDELRYSRGRGNVKPAVFDVVPRLPPGPDGRVTERAVLDLAVNFYLEGRWCGEALKAVEVRARPDVTPSSELPVKVEPEWRRVLHAEPGAAPPDLLVRIQRDPSTGGFLWTCLTPHVALPRPAGEEARTPPLAHAEDFARQLFEPLARKPLSEISKLNVEGAGEQIYASTPPAFRDAYWRVFDAARTGRFRFATIQLVTDEPHVPWELMRVADTERGPEVEPEFLAIRHSVGRWVAGSSCRLTQRIEVRDLAVFATGYPALPESQRLPWAESEGRQLAERFGGVRYPVRRDPLLEFLGHGQAESVHFACHGKMYLSFPNQSVLVMEDEPQELTPLVIDRWEVRKGLGKKHPLVFLNACQVGATGETLSLVTGFPSAFLGAGAAAVVSPLWTVHDERAADVTERFYAAVLREEGRPIGEVLQEIRARWREEGHLTYLAYVLYGDPRARVSYRPRRAAGPKSAGNPVDPAAGRDAG